VTRIKRKKDPLGIDGPTIEYQGDDPVVATAAVVELVKSRSTEARLSRLAAVPEFGPVADRLRKQFDTHSGDAPDRLRLELVKAELDAARTLARSNKSKGGVAKRANNHPDWHVKAVEAAQSLLASGKSPHELGNVLAKRFDKNPKTVRTVLHKAGVFPKK
jgi:hypothetical protein